MTDLTDDEARIEELETVCAELYQVIASLAVLAGVFEHPDVQNALDNASQHKKVHELLPWPSDDALARRINDALGPGVEPMTITDDDAIRERVDAATKAWGQRGVYLECVHLALDEIPRLLDARKADRKEIERLKTAKIEAATMADQAAREELAKEAKEQAIRLAATIAADARLAERARCVQAIKDRVIDSAIRQASIRAIEASDA